ncbi:hypothetical protein A7982_13394 [Minicystis rosea]|nr:hypothetical protein A7982_13394 [Minicystis rosea]
MTADGSGLGDEDETPPTRSYVEALLEGSLTRDQIEALRAEIAAHLPYGVLDDDDDGGRTQFHTYTEAERRTAIPEALEDDDEGARTRFHTYTEAERRTAIPEALEDDEDEGARTRFHTYTAEEHRSAFPEALEDDEGARTQFHTYTEAERRSAFPEVLDDDDARTHFRLTAAPLRRSAFPELAAYAPTEPPVAPADDGEDDDGEARTLFRPSSPVRAASLIPASSRHSMHSSLPPSPRSSSNLPARRASQWPSHPPSKPPPSNLPLPAGRRASGADTPIVDLDLTWTPAPASVGVPSSYRPRGDEVPSSRPALGHAAPPAPLPDPMLVEEEMAWAAVFASSPPAAAPLPDPMLVEEEMAWAAAFASSPPAAAPLAEIEIEELSDLPLIDLELALGIEVPGHVDDTSSEAIYLDALGGPAGVPCLAVSPGELTRFSLGREAGFLLSRIDGESCVDDIIDISGLGRLETLSTLNELLQQGVIVIRR